MIIRTTFKQHTGGATRKKDQHERTADGRLSRQETFAHAIIMTGFGGFSHSTWYKQSRSRHYQLGALHLSDDSQIM